MKTITLQVNDEELSKFVKLYQAITLTTSELLECLIDSAQETTSTVSPTQKTTFDDLFQELVKEISQTFAEIPCDKEENFPGIIYTMALAICSNNKIKPLYQ